MALDVAMGAMVRIHMNFQVKLERITVTFNWHCIIEAFLDGNQILPLGAIQVVLGETRHPNYAVSRPHTSGLGWLPTVDRAPSAIKY